jgi:ABC-2 type transport system permease protein
MVAALLYLQYHSIKNRTVMRFKRLKQPKYLMGAIVGGLYFYFYFYRWLFAGRSRQPSFAAGLTAENQLLYELIAALVLFMIVLLAWVVPHERAALAFTEAEVAFLFPAPISRRGLIHFKLLRSQTAILFTTLLLTLVTNMFGGHAWIRGAGWWIVLCTLNLHLLGSSFARTMLLDRGITNWQRRAGILGLVLVLGGIVVVWTRHSLPPFDFSELTDLDVVKGYIREVLTSGPARFLLYPFRLLVRPYFATGGLAFLSMLAGPLLILVLHYWWVLRSDVAFEEASVDASRKLAERTAAIRSGNWQSQKKARGRRAPFRLHPLGPTPIALLWKNLISAGQAFTLRVWITLAAVGLGASVGLRGGLGSSGLVPALGMVVVMLLIWSLLLGPQFLRQDFRQDLPLADMLKLYPMRGWQVALGELLAPAVILTGIQWFLLILGVSLFSRARVTGNFALLNLLVISLGAALVFPFLNLITLQIPNAAVLLFPAWFQASKEGAQGIEATGQRLIFMLGQFFVFVLALVPATGVGAGVFILAKFVLGLTAGLGLGSVAVALTLAIEATLGLMLLGYLFDRFDLSSEASR